MMYVIIGVIVIAAVLTVVLIVFKGQDVPNQQKPEVPATSQEQTQTLKTLVPSTSDLSIKSPVGPVFSIKEAVSHGMRMVRKYLGTFFIVFFIFLVFYLVSWPLSSQAGKGVVTNSDMASLYKQRDVADNFFKYLYDAGYVNEIGFVQAKLENLKDPSELVLPASFENDKNKIFSFLKNYAYRLPFPKIIYYLLSLSLFIINFLMNIGFLKIILMTSRDQKPPVLELFSNGTLLIKFILANICSFLALMGVCLVGFIPGIIFAMVPGMLKYMSIFLLIGGVTLAVIIVAVLMIAWGMAPYFIVDKHIGPIQALKASFVLTRGCRWHLFLFYAVLFFFNIAGALCLLVGLLFTWPASGVAGAYIYDQLKLKRS